MGTLAELIEIYGRQPTDAVSNDVNYRHLCAENDKVAFFHTERLLVEKLKRELEERVGIQQTRHKQVQHAVRFFFRRVREQSDGGELKKAKICHALTVRAYYPNWTDKQKVYFDAITERLDAKHDYFLSFTQRNRNGGGNPINSFHRYLIQSYGLPDPKDSPNNELAHLIYRVLNQSPQGFRGFFYPQEENDSNVVTQKLADAMKNSSIFIQLLQNEMFDSRYPASPNYCFDEYNQAIAQRKEMVYVFADGAHPGNLIVEEAVHSDFDPWYRIISKVDCLDFATTSTADDSVNVRPNQNKLLKWLEQVVQSRRDSYWKDVPGDVE